MTNILRLAFCAACAGLVRAEDGGVARPAKPDQFRVSNWTSEQGLPQNTVTSLIQTRDGYLWAGTRHGLARFDGVQWTAFVDELSAIADESLNVWSVAEDAAGRLWFHSQHSLTCFEAGGFKRVSLETLPFPGRIQHLTASWAGGVWVTKVGGIFRWVDGKAEQAISLSEIVEKSGGKGEELMQSSEDAQGRLWVRKIWNVGSRSVWQRLDFKTGEVEPLTHLLGIPETEDIRMVMEDRTGRIWTGRPGELLCWDGRLTRFGASAVWGDYPVAGLAEDAAGGIWIVSHGPIRLHRFAGGQFTSFGRAEGVRTEDDIRCALSDR